MVTKPLYLDMVLDQRWRRQPTGNTRLHYRREVKIVFSIGLFDKILTEAKSREWSFGRMVRHLCEASIDGIE